MHARISTALIVGFLVGIFCCGVRILQFYYWDKSLIHDVFMLGVLFHNGRYDNTYSPLWKYCILDRSISNRNISSNQILCNNAYKEKNINIR